MQKLATSLVLLAGVAVLTPSSAAAARPSWCKGYESEGDNSAKWIDGYLRDGHTPKVLNYMAKAGCDKPSDSQRKADFKRWRKGYDDGLLNDKQFAEAMALHIDKDKYRQGYKKYCERYDSLKSEPLAQRIRKGALAEVMGCEHVTVKDVVAWADWDAVSQVDRLLMLSANNKPTAMNAKNYVVLAKDLEALDLKKLERELTAHPVYERVVLRRLAARYILDGKKSLEASRKRLVKDHPEYKQLFAAAEDGWSAWQQAYRRNKAAMDLARDFERAYWSGERSVLEGCEKRLYEPLAAHIAALAPKTESHAEAAVSDMVGYRLLWSLVICTSENDDPVAARALADASLRDIWRGPRFAAYNFAEAKRRSEGWRFVKPIIPMPHELPQAYKKFSLARPMPKVERRAQVRAVKASKTAGRDVVTFNRVKMKVYDWQCTEDEDSWEVVGNGQLRHPVYCKPVGQPRLENYREEPILANPLFVADLKPKTFVTWLTYHRRNDGPRDGMPLAIYADGDQKKLIGYFGARW